MTVGKLSSLPLLDEAYEDVINCSDKFSTMIEKISVEMIGAYDESIIIMEHKLT
jgi:hypothetical protein